MFNKLVGVYEALIDWPRRLANEEPFYRELFARARVRSVLDAACGTGHHTAMFHSWGLRVEGADISPEMIARCRAQHGQSDSLRWAVRGFEEPLPPGQRFDAVICVGNSLALAPSLAAVESAVAAMLAATQPSGVCVIQVLNLWHLPDGPCVWQKCRRVTLGQEDHVLVKGVHRSGSRGFVNLVDLTMSADGVTPRYESTMFWGLESDWLMELARRAGARQVRCLGNFEGANYERNASPDLIVVAER